MMLRTPMLIKSAAFPMGYMRGSSELAALVDRQWCRIVSSVGYLRWIAAHK